MGEAATNPGQLVDAGDGLGGGADRPLGEGSLDAVGVVGELAGRSGAGIAASQRLQATVAVGEEVAFGGGDADVSDACGVIAGVPQMNGPEDVSFCVGRPDRDADRGRPARRLVRRSKAWVETRRP